MKLEGKYSYDIMRLDHLAYRVRDRKITAKFFQEAFGYKVQQEFQLDFGDNHFADCIALEPPEKTHAEPPHPWICPWVNPWGTPDCVCTIYHLAPEIFVSDGNEGSIVGDWVAKRDGIGGIHHIAYQVDDVEATMREWREKGYAEFSSEEPLKCPGLTQVFTKPSQLTGVIYEFINRQEFGFCKDNVRGLMESTKGL